MKKLLSLVLIVLALGCKDDVTTDIADGAPTWLNEMIKKGKDDHGTFSSVYSYLYRGQEVFLVVYSPACCDQFASQLFDNKGNRICFPTGGISGQGDLQCKDFENAKSNEKLYWTKGK